MEKNRIGKEIKNYRKLRGMSQQELAKLVGLYSKNMISRFENGESIPKLEKTLPLICKALDIDFDIVFKDLKE